MENVTYKTTMRQRDRAYHGEICRSSHGGAGLKRGMKTEPIREGFALSVPGKITL